MRPNQRANVMLCVFTAISFAVVRGGAVGADEPIDAALDLVPAGALAAVIVPNCASTSDQLGRLNDVLGLRVPELVDVLSEMKQRSGLREGIVDDGAAIFIVRGLFANAAAVPGIALLPVEDFGRFTANFETETVDGVSRLQMPGGRAPYAKPIPGYAVVGADRQSVASFQPPSTPGAWLKMMGPIGRYRLALADVGLIINVEKIAPMLQPLVTEVLRFQLDNSALIPEDRRAGCAALFGITDASISAFLRDTRAVVLALDLQNDGVSLSVTAQFRGDSPLAGLFHGKGPATPELLVNLPDDPFLMAAAVNTNGFSLQKFFPKLVEHVPGEMSGVAQILRHEENLVAQLRGQAFVIYGDRARGQSGEAAIQYAAALEVADSKTFIRTVREMLTAINGQVLQMAPGVEATITASYRANERAIGGIQCDRYEIHYEFLQNDEQRQVYSSEMVRMLGLDQSSGYIAAIDEHRVVQTNTTDAQMISKLVAAARAPTGLGAQGAIPVARMSDLDASPDLEMYANITDILRFAEPWIGRQAPRAPRHGGAAQQDESRLLVVRADLASGGVGGRVFIPMHVLRRISHALALPQSSQFGGAMPLPHRR